MLPAALEYPLGAWNGFRVYRPARGGRLCEHFGGYKTINRIPLPLFIHVLVNFTMGPMSKINILQSWDKKYVYIYTHVSAPKRFAKFGRQKRTFCGKKEEKVWGAVCSMHTFVDRSKFCPTKVILSTTKLFLSDKSWFCQTKVDFVRQKLILSDKSWICQTKVDFVWQKQFCLDKNCFCQQK